MLGWLRRTFADPKIGRRLLREEDEVIVDEVAHHWVVHLFPGALALLGLVTLCSVPWWNARIGWFGILLGLGLLLYAGWKSLNEHMDRFVVTNMRVFRVSGVLGQSAATMPLGRVLDITVQQPLLGRILGYGHFVFESAAQEQGLREIHFVGRPHERDLVIQREVQRAGLRGKREHARFPGLQPDPTELDPTTL